jgi:hypothetical protein
MNKKLIVLGMIAIASVMYLLRTHYTVGEESWCAVDHWNNTQCYYESYEECMKVVQLPDSIWVSCKKTNPGG